MSAILERFVPHEADYKSVDKFSDRADLILAASTVLTFVLSLAEKFNVWQKYALIGISINTLLIVFYFISDVFSSLVFTKAEAKRRLGFIDNSFDTKFTGERSSKYFNNDDLDPSVYKMAVNTFESSFFTKNILDKMLKRAYITSGFILTFFLIAAVIGNQKLVRLLVETPVMFVVLQKTIKMKVFSNRVEEIVDKFNTLFNDIFNNACFTDKNVPSALRNVLDYESIISWAVIPLSNPIFKAFNPELTKKWEDLKQYYKILDVDNKAS